MRILHIIPDIGISNGIMSVILNFAKAMPDDITFDVAYFCETEKTRQSDIEALGGCVYKIDAPSPSAYVSGSYKKFFAAHRNEWSALHIHAPHFAVFIAPFAKRAGLKKICVHCHSTEFSLKGNSARNKLFSLYSNYFVKDRFACSEEAGRYWFGSKRYTVVNNAVNCRDFIFDGAVRSEKRSELGLGDCFTLAHIGRTDITQKNHAFLLDVFFAVRQRRPDAVLLLIGAEPTEPLTAMAEAAGCRETVRFLGFRSDIRDLLMAADCFVFPSLSEGLPVSLVEAQAAGLPVLMSDTITKEVMVTPECKALSLNDGAEVWADEVLLTADLQRKNHFGVMQAAGWEISSAAQLLIDYYRKEA